MPRRPSSAQWILTTASPRQVATRQLTFVRPPSSRRGLPGRAAGAGDHSGQLSSARSSPLSGKGDIGLTLTAAPAVVAEDRYHHVEREQRAAEVQAAVEVHENTDAVDDYPVEPVLEYFFRHHPGHGNAAPGDQRIHIRPGGIRGGVQHI